MSDTAKVWIGGRIVDGNDAYVSVFDHGLLYGDGVFEGMRVYGGRVFRKRDHLERLAVSARAVGMAALDTEALARVVDDTVDAFGRAEAYVRLIVTRGKGPLSVDPTKCFAPTVVCIVDEVALYPAEKLEKGVDLVTVSIRRPGADVLEPRVKSLNYLNNALAILEARRVGADEALLLNRDGAVAEASGANVFVVRGGRVSTPPATDGALEGITRRTILELCEELGVPAVERRLGRIDLLGADEVFLAGTGARLVPVATVDGQPIGVGSAHRTVYARLRTAYDGRVREVAA
jgi:branched-chain amino acid aminotransferase